MDMTENLLSALRVKKINCVLSAGIPAYRTAKFLIKRVRRHVMLVCKEEYATDPRSPRVPEQRRQHGRTHAAPLLLFSHPHLMDIKHIGFTVQARKRIAVGKTYNSILPQGRIKPTVLRFQKALRCSAI